MVRIVNENLFSVNTEKKNGTYGDFYCTSFASMIETPNLKKQNENYKRVLASIRHSNEDSFNKENTRVIVNRHPENNNTNFVRIAQAETYKFDTDVYLIAIPFSGIIKPMEKTYDYRIYKAFVAKSDKFDINVNGKSYNKIAYMIVSLNNNLFKEDNEYHKDKLELVFETFSLVAIEDQDIKQSVKTSYIISFTKDGNYEVDIKTENVENINSKEFKGKSIFYIFEPKVSKDEEEKSDNKKRNNKNVKFKTSKPRSNYVKPALKTSGDDDQTVYSDSEENVGSGYNAFEDMIKKMNQQEKEYRSDREKRNKKKGKHYK